MVEKWGVLLIVAAGMLAAIPACTADPLPQSNTAVSTTLGQQSPEPSSSRFPPPSVASMKRQLLAEPKILDLIYNDEPSAVTWQIGVADDGSRREGYADYVCMLLAESHLVDDRVSVRVVDMAKLQAAGGDFRAASLGHVRCASSERIAA